MPARSSTAVEPDRAAAVEPDRAGAAEPDRGAVVEPDRAGAAEPDRAGAVEPDRAAVVEAVLGASRVLVAVAARSLADVAEEVTLPQYRALVVLISRGPQRVASLAEALAVTPPTATRMCDRLVRKGLVRRRTPAEDRREVRLSITPTGRELVARVTERRRLEIAGLLQGIPARDQAAMVELFGKLARAAGEVPDQDWAAGWEL